MNQSVATAHVELNPSNRSRSIGCATAYNPKQTRAPFITAAMCGPRTFRALVCVCFIWSNGERSLPTHASFQFAFIMFLSNVLSVVQHTHTCVLRAAEARNIVVNYAPLNCFSSLFAKCALRAYSRNRSITSYNHCSCAHGGQLVLNIFLRHIHAIQFNGYRVKR